MISLDYGYRVQQELPAETTETILNWLGQQNAFGGLVAPKAKQRNESREQKAGYPAIVHQ